MEQLVEGVLAVGARLAPDDLAGGDVDRRAVAGHRLAVGLHAQLLQVGGEAGQVLRVGQDRLGLRAEEVDVPDARSGRAAPAGSPRRARSGSARRWCGSRRASRGSAPGPMATISESPIAEVKEYRPPTQSQKPNMFAVSMPNSATFSALVETATKCLATALSSPPSPSSSQRRASVALVSVSCVVKVLDATMNSVRRRVEVAGRLGEVGRVDVGDEAEGQRPVGVVAQRQVGHRRAEVGAADADVDHGADPLAGVPGPLPAAHPVGELAHPVEHLVHVVPTSWPSTSSPLVAGSRSATCRTARSSVVLMCSPRNIASVRSRSPARSASATSSPIVSSVSRFLE